MPLYTVIQEGSGRMSLWRVIKTRIWLYGIWLNPEIAVSEILAEMAIRKECSSIGVKV